MVFLWLTFLTKKRILEIGMKAYRVGYILTLSFLLVLFVVSATLGFYPAPKGPKAPEYPKYDSYGSSSGSYNDYYNSNSNYDSYNDKLKQYDEDMKDYEAEQKSFMRKKVIPYVRNVFVFWIILLAAFQVVGLFLAKMGADLVGGAFAFSGVLAVVFGPFTGLIWFANSAVSSFSGRSQETFSLDPLWQALTLTSFLGILGLTVLGLLLFGPLHRRPSPPPVA